ncbi:AraC family transcriptional regulator [Alteromonas sediminis]|uniref:AraC family transcriptional regulator n=1 Tax=Alteromonas sediminis TaxID=2259342 RepID=A0A3N5Y2I4_9ALTE|nr:helix-turn-helix domain-containing protein [Alteromonas sediminis]RPJ67223.1 AraC family transcriptional regulator [Alteromonas sediminis]
MFETLPHIVLLILAVLSMASLFLFRPNRLEHYLYAALGFSLMWLAIGQLLPGSFSIEQQFVSLGTFATCNVFWLLTRSLFRQGKALVTSHFILAGIIAFLILSLKSIALFVHLSWIDGNTLLWLERALSELLQLLSSGVLLLSFWEIIRGYGPASKRVRFQKKVLAVTMVLAVLSTRIVVPALSSSPAFDVALYLITRSLAASAIILAILYVLWSQHKHRETLGNTSKSDAEDAELLTAIESMMQDKKLFLQSELKLIDIALAIDQPEYKIRKVINEQMSFDNVNQYINHLRIKHAKDLLLSEQSQHWSILVVSMESGFSSLATFNRVFKQQVGCTPKQFKTQHATT